MLPLFVDIAKCNFLRTIRHKLSSKYSDKDCYSAFVGRMNEKSIELGMNNTRWINPSGLGETGIYSMSTARDLARLTAAAIGNSLIKDCWGQKDRIINVKKPFIFRNNKKQKMLHSTLNYNELPKEYKVIGGKTGSGDGYNTLVLAWETGGAVVAGAIMGASSEKGRFEAMSELMMVSEKSLKETLSGSENVKSAHSACSYLVSGGSVVKCLYEKDSDFMSPPMSTTKIMTVLLASEIRKDVVKSKQLHEIVPSDVRNTVLGDVLHKWEALSFEDMIAASLMSSSNVASNAIARIIGKEIIKKRNDASTNHSVFV